MQSRMSRYYYETPEERSARILKTEPPLPPVSMEAEFDSDKETFPFLSHRTMDEAWRRRWQQHRWQAAQ